MASLARSDARSHRASSAGADGKAQEEIFFKSTKAMVSSRGALPGKAIKKLARRPMKAFQ